LLLIGVFLFLLPQVSNGQDEFYATFVDPGYAAMEFFTVPWGTASLEFDDEGNLYVDGSHSDTQVMTIWKFIAKENGYELPPVLFFKYSTDLRFISGLDFDDYGNLFVTEGNWPGDDGSDSGRIRKLDPDGNTIGTVTFDEFRPTGIATGKIDNQAEIYFPGRKWSDTDFGNIYSMSSFPDASEDITLEGAIATGIAINDSGNIFLAYRDGSIWVRDKETQAVLQIAKFNRYVEELNCDADSNLYALEPKGGPDPSTIIQLTPLDVVAIEIDIKPGSCPNPINLTSRGVLPVAILGNDDLDVTDINLDSVRLMGVPPLRWSFENVSTSPDCNDNYADQFEDLTLKFDMQKISQALLYLSDGEKVILPLGGKLTDDTPIRGQDIVVVINKEKKGKGKE